MQITQGKINRPQRVVIYGTEGIGKSTFASHFPDPLFIDTEGSTAHLDVKRLPEPTSWSMIFEEIDFVVKNPSSCKTLVIDTADWAEQLAAKHVCATNKVPSIESIGYGKGYVYLEEEFGKLLNRLSDVIDKGITVVITAHSEIKKFEQPDEMGAYDRYQLKLEKKTAPLLKEWSDLLLFANYKTIVLNVDNQGARKGVNKAQGNGRRVMYTSHMPSWDAKNRHNLEGELPFDYGCIKKIIESYLEADTIKNDLDQVAKEYNKLNEREKEAVVEKFDEKVSDDGSNVKEAFKEAKNESKQLVDHKRLNDLLVTNNVTVEEVQDVVSLKGYFPQGTPIVNYPDAFINGVLVGAWPQVYKMILENRK